MPITHTRVGGLPTSVMDKPASMQFGLAVASAVQARAFDQGRGSDDKPLKPYAPSYAAARRRRGMQVSPPNLQDTGRMRRAYRVIHADRGRVMLSVTGAAARYARHVEASRPFLKPSKNDIRVVRRRVPAIVVGAIRRSVQP